MSRLYLLTEAPVAESPAMHIRNAIQLLIAFEATNPAVWLFAPELPAVQARLFHALFLLEGEET